MPLSLGSPVPRTQARGLCYSLSQVRLDADRDRQPRVVEVVRVLPRLVPALVTAAPFVPIDGDGKIKMSITMPSRDKHSAGRVA